MLITRGDATARCSCLFNGQFLDNASHSTAFLRRDLYKNGRRIIRHAKSTQLFRNARRRNGRGSQGSRGGRYSHRRGDFRRSGAILSPLVAIAAFITAILPYTAKPTLFATPVANVPTKI